MSRPHAVVTGGAGFLGSHLVDALLEDEFRVTSLDNFGSGRQSNLAHVESDHFENRRHDVREPFPAFDHVDEVYHLASRASPDDFVDHAVEIALTNSEGTHNAYECALEHDAPVLLASTSEVYGDPDVNPQPESYTGNVNVRGPRAPYDESKRFSEALAIAYEQQHDLDVRTVRIFNTYGPRMRPDDGRAVPNFLSQALRNEDLTVYGDGSQTRCFCFVSDLVRGFRTIMEADADVVSGEAFNLGSTEEITIETLAETVLEVLDTESEVAYRELPEDDPKVRHPDLSKTDAALDWEQRVSLEEGLRRTAEEIAAELDLDG